MRLKGTQYWQYTLQSAQDYHSYIGEMIRDTHDAVSSPSLITYFSDNHSSTVSLFAVSTNTDVIAKVMSSPTN